MNNLMIESLNSVNNIIEKVVEECSKHYGFNSEEAMIRLGLKEGKKEEKVVLKEVVLKEVVLKEGKKEVLK